MARVREDEFAEMPGQDSFLDVVANMVGIMILLVMVMGARAASSGDIPEAAEIDESEYVTEEEAQAAERAAMNAERDLLEMAVQASKLRQQTLMRETERQMLAELVVGGEREIADRRAKLGDEQQRDFDLRRRLSDAQKKLDDLTREQISLLAQEPQMEVVEALPTPLAKTVTGDEIHVHLANGHAAVVPIDKLQKEAEVHFERNIWRLRENGNMDGLVGPIDEFRLRYKIRITRVSTPGAAGMGQIHNVPRMKFEYLPMSSQVGAPLEQALMPTSDLMRELRGRRPSSTTVTIWFYPDSFSEFRQLKKALFDLGFAAAGRPLPAGQEITASPSGTKSAAQ
jgi:hypothetical protein